MRTFGITKKSSDFWEFDCVLGFRDTGSIFSKVFRHLSIPAKFADLFNNFSIFSIIDQSWSPNFKNQVSFFKKNLSVKCVMNEFLKFGGKKSSHQYMDILPLSSKIWKLTLSKIDLDHSIFKEFISISFEIPIENYAEKYLNINSNEIYFFRKFLTAYNRGKP